MLPRLLVITNRHQAERGCGSLEGAVEASLEAGARLIQLREKDLSDGDLRQLAEGLLPAVRRCDARLLINARADLAKALDADGLHRPSDGPPVGRLREILGDDAIIGCSTHSLEEAERAEDEGADYATFSPIFSTSSKPGYGPPRGLGDLARVCRAVDIPVFALAGVTPERVEPCREAGAHGVAVMGGVMREEDPGEAVRSYLAEL
ncbi:MAG: thiamine phosphate synthase [Persicimonas sp.]